MDVVPNVMPIHDAYSLTVGLAAFFLVIGLTLSFTWAPPPWRQRKRRST